MSTVIEAAKMFIQTAREDGTSSMLQPGRRVVIAIRSYRARLLDYGNLVAGAKPIPDCLKRLGVIHDDSPKWFDCTYTQYAASPEDRRTEIEIP